MKTKKSNSVKKSLTNRLKNWAIIVALILLIPLILTIKDGGIEGVGWNWTFFDFVFMGTLLFGSAMTYELVARKVSNPTYRIAVGLAALTTVLLIWINAAVGIIGDGPINTLFLGIPTLGFIGALIARFQPHGMSRTLFAMALAQILVPIIALAIKTPDFAPGILGVFILNGIFAILWTGSGLLFQRVKS